MSSWEEKAFALVEGIPRKFRKLIMKSIIHADIFHREGKITFHEAEEAYLDSQRNNLKNWHFYTTKLEEELKAGVRKHGMDIWVYQMELIELLITCQFKDADRVLQKFKDYAVDAIDDKGVFTVWDGDKCQEDSYDSSTDGGYLNKANFIMDFIKEYEDMLNLFRTQPIIREMVEQIVLKTTQFIHDEL